MQRVKRSTAISVLPAAPAGGTPGYFATPNPSGGISATIPGNEWYNNVQEELCAVIEASGLTLSDGDRTQLLQAVKKIAAVSFHCVSLTTSGNFTTPANITMNTVFKITLVGGGAGGGGSNGTVSASGGGGSGGAASFFISGLSPSTAYAVVIGTYGAGGSVEGGAGGTGGATQVTIGGMVYSALGGIAGPGSVSATGIATSIQGAVSASVLALPHITYKQSTPAAGFAYSVSVGLAASGSSITFGSGGQGGYASVGTGGNASGFGAGGGGGLSTLSAGGNGAPGLFIAEWIA